MISQQTLRTETTDRAPRSTQVQDYFEGLPEGVSHYDVFQLVQNLEKKIGLSSAAVQHLHYLITHTREVDWQPGAVPIVYRSVQNTATDRGRCVRAIRKIEDRLADAGLIQFNDVENYKRYGRRDRNGRIEFAYGVDLTPLGLMYPKLVELNERHMAYMAAFTETKRKVSALRRRIRNKMRWLEDLDIEVEDLIGLFEEVPKVEAGMTITALTDILNQVRQIHSQLDDLLQEHRHQKSSMAEEEKSQKTGLEGKESSDGSEQECRHIQSTVSLQSIDIDCNQQVDDDKERVGEEYSCGLEHITYDQVLDAATDAFVDCLQSDTAADRYTDLVNAASRRCHQLGIGRWAWMKARSAMGDTAAAVAVVILDRNRAHPLIPVVNPGGVLRGMTAKAQAGELHLHRSLYAILKWDRKGNG